LGFKQREKLSTLEGHNSGITSLAFSPDGSILAGGSFDRSIYLWSVKKAQPIVKLKEHSGQVTSIAFSPNGKYFASASLDSTVKIWAISKGKSTLTLKSPIPSSVMSLAFSDGNKVLASGQEDGTVVIWITKTFNTDENEMVQYITLHVQHAAIRALDFSRTSKYLASGSSSGQGIIYNIKNGTVYKRLKNHSGGITAVSFSPRHDILATAAHDRTIRIIR